MPVHDYKANLCGFLHVEFAEQQREPGLGRLCFFGADVVIAQLILEALNH